MMMELCDRNKRYVVCFDVVFVDVVVFFCVVVLY